MKLTKDEYNHVLNVAERLARYPYHGYFSCVVLENYSKTLRAKYTRFYRKDRGLWVYEDGNYLDLSLRANEIRVIMLLTFAEVCK